MEDRELYNPQNGEVIKAKGPKQFWKDWRFYVYSLIAIMLAIVSFSSCLTACAAINAGVGQKEDASYSVAERKNAVITTDGGYSGYSFSVSSAFAQFDIGDFDFYWFLYDVNTSFTLTEYSSGSVTIGGGYQNIVNRINSLYSSSHSTDSNDLRFLACFFKGSIAGTSSTYPYMYYFSFVAPNNSSYGISPRPFIYKNRTSTSRMERLDNAVFIGNPGDSFIVTDGGMCPYFLVDSVSLSRDSVFQDVASYYQELGYQDGYDDGNSQGYSSGYGVGHSAGYNEGYASGNANGYASGYEQATQDYQTGVAFTSYGLYANAQLTLTTDEVIGNYSYMYLFKYVTSNYDEHTVYVLFTQNSSTSQYLGYVLDRNDSDDSTSAVTIGSFSAQSSLAVTITAEQDQYFELYTGFVTSFFDRGSEVIEAVWFSGGTSQTALQNYQDGYDTGYQDGVSAGYGSGYDAGYRVGEVAGINQAEPEALTNTLVAVFQQPFNQIYRFFNFNILGLNVLGLATGLLSVFIIIKVFKKVLK